MRNKGINRYEWWSLEEQMTGTGILSTFRGYSEPKKSQNREKGKN